MLITVKFFATYRDLVGTNQLEMQIGADATIADVLHQLKQQYPQLSEKLETMALVAVNEKYAPHKQKLNANDTVAFFPPVSGG